MVSRDLVLRAGGMRKARARELVGQRWDPSADLLVAAWLVTSRDFSQTAHARAEVVRKRNHPVPHGSQTAHARADKNASGSCNYPLT